MRYTKRKYKLQSRINERRVVKRFLFFPKTLLRETRWLETAEIEQSVVREKSTYKWKSVKFIDQI